jgi:hypothetical protein
MKRTPNDQRAFPLLRRMIADPVKKERLIAQLSNWVWHRPNGCIEYWSKQGRDTHGKSYPRIRLWYKGEKCQVYAHRLFWMLREKRPIPEGYEVGHTCHNFRCVLHTELQHKSYNAADANHRRWDNVKAH